MEVGPISGGMSTGTTGPATGETTPPAGSQTTPADTTPPETAEPKSLLDTFLEGTIPAGTEMLSDAFGDLNSIDLLIALLLLSAMKGDDDDSGGGAALGFLAGLALAGQLGRSIHMEFNLPVENLQLDTGVGENMNFTA